jgi:hypothetical protein
MIIEDGVILTWYSFVQDKTTTGIETTSVSSRDSHKTYKPNTIMKVALALHSFRRQSPSKYIMYYFRSIYKYIVQ